MASGLANGLAVKTTFHGATLVQSSPPTEEKSVPRGAWCCTPMLNPILEQASKKRTWRSAEKPGPQDSPALLVFLLDKGAAKQQPREGLYPLQLRQERSSQAGVGKKIQWSVLDIASSRSFYVRLLLPLIYIRQYKISGTGRFGHCACFRK